MRGPPYPSQPPWKASQTSWLSWRASQPAIWEALPTHPSLPGGPPVPSQPFQNLASLRKYVLTPLTLCEGLLTLPVPSRGHQTLMAHWERLPNPPDPSRLSRWPSWCLLALQQGLPTTPNPPEHLQPSEGPSDLSWSPGRAYRPLLVYREGLPTLHVPNGDPLNHPGSRVKTFDPAQPTGRAFRCLPTPPNLSGGPPVPSRSSRKDSRPHLALLEGLSILTALLGGFLTPPSPLGRPRDSFQPLSYLRQSLPTLPGPPEGCSGLSWLSGKASQPLQKTLPTPTAPPGGPANPSYLSCRASQLFPTPHIPPNKPLATSWPSGRAF